MLVCVILIEISLIIIITLFQTEHIQLYILRELEKIKIQCRKKIKLDTRLG